MRTKSDKVKKVGRPSLYTNELAEDICMQIATSSKSMKTICSELKISVATVITWLSEGHRNYISEFAKQYARAKELQADYLAEELMEIADDSGDDLLTIDEYGNRVENREFVNRSKLRVDARKWIASKLKPKRYGDKIDVTTDGESVNTTIDLSKVPTDIIKSLLDASK